MPTAYNESKDYAVSKDVVFKEVLAALNILGFKVENSDEPNGLIEAHKGVSFRSWGESIRISIAASNGRSRVNVESRAYQAVDWGKNRDNVRQIMTELDIRILSSMAVPPPPPPPPTVPQTCPTCGKQLTFIQQYARWYCSNCKKYV
jgi:hypothetical protein